MTSKVIISKKSHTNNLVSETNPTKPDNIKAPRATNLFCFSKYINIEKTKNILSVAAYETRD